MEKLLAFLRFLNEKIGFKFEVNNFDHRLKLQKYVFISKFLGMNFKKYTYSIYLRGPYSRSLADDYYHLEPNLISDEEYEKYLSGFKKEKFVEVVNGKDERWLEITATLLSVYKDYKRIFKGDELEKRIIETTSSIKSTASIREIKLIFEELKKYGLIKI